MMEIKRKILRAKIDLKNRLPRPLKHPREFIALPFRMAVKKDTGFDPEDYEYGREFIVLCKNHVEEFEREQDLASEPTLGYYVCQRKGCWRPARYELFPGLDRRLENLSESVEGLEEYA